MLKLLLVLGKYLVCQISAIYRCLCTSVESFVPGTWKVFPVSGPALKYLNDPRCWFKYL